jgi:hypothetical protein
VNTHNCEAPGIWWVEARYKGNPVKPRFNVVVNAYPQLVAGVIKDGQTICNGGDPDELEQTSLPTGGNGVYSYQWQQSPDGVDEWTNINGATTTTYDPPALTEDTYYRLNVTSCTTESSNVVKITVYPASLSNYPDIRIRVCPDPGTSINLSKYIDTLAVTSLNWESVSPPVPISNDDAGTIAVNNLTPYTRVYTFAYTVVNPCATDIKRKVYLETLEADRMRPLRDSIMICHKYAENLQLNQIFGIDARGTWTFADEKVKAYVTESTSPTYGGAVILNGKAIYKDTSIADYIYHGKSRKRVTVTYTPASDSCLAGQTFTILIILTDDIKGE